MIASSLKITRNLFEMYFIKAILKERIIMDIHKRDNWLYCFSAVVFSPSPCEICNDTIAFIFLFFKDIDLSFLESDSMKL